MVSQSSSSWNEKNSRMDLDVKPFHLQDFDLPGRTQLKSLHCCNEDLFEEEEASKREFIGRAECCKRGVRGSFIICENFISLCTALVLQEVSARHTALIDYSLSLKRRHYLSANAVVLLYTVLPPVFFLSLQICFVFCET